MTLLQFFGAWLLVSTLLGLFVGRIIHNGMAGEWS